MINDHHLSGLFNHLTPENVIDAIEVGGRRCTGRFIILNSYENRVYQFEMDDESWVVGKFYRPGRWSLETILAEHEFLAELAEVEIPVACPMEIESGRTVGKVEGIWYSIFPRIGGRAPEELDDEQVRVLGRLVGRIHNVGAQHDTEHRIGLSPQTYGTQNLEYLLDNDVIPEEARDAYADTARQLIDLMIPLFENVPMHRIHGDCHLANLVWAPGGPTFLDFDDMVIGPAVQDIWMIVPSSDEYGQRQRDVLIEAYSQFRDFSPTWLRLVEPLRALRFIHYSTWIARRWHDPIFTRTFDYFGTIQYWQKEIQDLREQLARTMELSWS
ncbi:MAG: serine/threonine protein kinase [Deltaproteobacteria bacterium]|nr:serine/threonine protein kinase [Deltaproteobacteria bacterium]